VSGRRRRRVDLPPICWRLALTLAFPLYQHWRVWRGAKLGGAFVAIRAPEDVLVIRHSYRRRLDLVGGGIERGETAREAAVREMREEIGVEPPPAALRELGRVRNGFRRIDEIDTLFEWRVERLPGVTIDDREVVWAGGLRETATQRSEWAITLRWYARRYGPAWAGGERTGHRTAQPAAPLAPRTR
jgi:8-oxo-dGTP pyrophosphatase MutT (NUDIX family)